MSTTIDHTPPPAAPEPPETPSDPELLASLEDRLAQRADRRDGWTVFAIGFSALALVAAVVAIGFGARAIGESKGKKNRFHYSPCSCSDEPKRNSVRSLMTRWPDHPMTRCVLISMVEAKTAS